MASEELKIVEKYKQDPAILKEFKADAYLQKIKAAMKRKGSSKEKIEAGKFVVKSFVYLYLNNISWRKTENQSPRARTTAHKSKPTRRGWYRTR